MNIQTTDSSVLALLRAQTHAVHEQLDHRIMSLGMFTNQDRYKNFVLMQYFFHRDINALYNDSALLEVIPDLVRRNRLALIEKDIADLDITVPELTPRPVPHDVSSATGWLYVAEGSKLGANILNKLAEKMGLNETFGANHLAPDPGGRGKSWNDFKEAVEAAHLDAQACAEGATQAFQRVIYYLEILEPAAIAI